MNFFEHQEVARRKTSLLVVYYFIAVLFIMFSVYLVIAGFTLGVEAKQSGGEIDFLKLWHPDLFIWVFGITFLIVFFGSSYKISQMRGGGKVVADMLGGRLINRNSSNANERKVLNVVEEMAIASGSPVPPVYLLVQETGINAFAAGYSTSDAVIGVTTGCIEQLSRDELQGVIAHEFSHIFNGDMRLNIRLIGVLHGILVIGLVGYFVFRSTLFSGRSRSKEKGGAMAIAFMGLAIWILGYVGVFFGNLIKSAVSRQREFLADASAVQFTRNPDGIAGALKKIGGFSGGSRLATPNAQETSHFFFSNGLKSAMFSAMATHPPLSERISRIDPGFSGDYKEKRRASSTAATAGSVSGFAGETTSYAVEPDKVVDSVGGFNAEHLEYATKLIAAIPDKLIDASREPYGARAVVYSLLLNVEEKPRALQLERLKQHADPAVYAETGRLAPLVESIARELRLPLADLAVSSLKELSKNQYVAFRENVDSLSAADDLIDLFEFTLKQMILRNLEPVFSRTARQSIRYRDIGAVSTLCAELMSCLAYWGSDDPKEANMAFAAGMKGITSGGAISISPISKCGLELLSKALGELALSTPMVKKQIIEGCVICVSRDGKITVEEAELLRSVADFLDCPIPPFLPGQRV